MTDEELKDEVWRQMVARNAVIRECAACIPTTWLDPPLSGPNKVAEIKDCPGVEKVLNAIRARILALEATHD